jgi:hypothetical protein
MRNLPTYIALLCLGLTAFALLTAFIAFCIR